MRVTFISIHSLSHFALGSLGSVDLTTVEKVDVRITDEEKARQERMNARPPLDSILNLHDFEVGLQTTAP